MVQYLNTQGAYSEIENIVNRAESTLVMMSPYIQINRTLLQKIFHASEHRGINVSLICRKQDIKPEEMDALKNDDLELLKLGFKWLQFGLLGRSTIPIREEVIKAKEKELGITLPKDDGLWKNPEIKTGK